MSDVHRSVILTDREEVMFRSEIYSQVEDREIEKAVCFLSRKYETSARNSKPFLVHSLRVAMIVEQAREKAELVVAAVLHDVLEDTDCSLAELQAGFSPNVAGLVEACSFKSEIEDYESQWREHFERLRGNRDALVIKAADILDNRRYTHLASPEVVEKVLKKHRGFIDVARGDIEEHPLFVQLMSDVG